MSTTRPQSTKNTYTSLVLQNIKTLRKIIQKPSQDTKCSKQVWYRGIYSGGGGRRAKDKSKFHLFIYKPLAALWVYIIFDFYLASGVWENGLVFSSIWTGKILVILKLVRTPGDTSYSFLISAKAGLNKTKIKQKKHWRMVTKVEGGGRPQVLKFRLLVFSDHTILTLLTLIVTLLIFTEKSNLYSLFWKHCQCSKTQAVDIFRLYI